MPESAPVRPTVNPAALLSLRLNLAGRAISSEEADYDARRGVWNAAVDASPALIVRALDAGDVARAVAFAHPGPPLARHLASPDAPPCASHHHTT